MFQVRKAYQEALLQRNLYPLKSGEYKLKEVKDFAEKYLFETLRISSSKKTGAPPLLKHCCPEDMHTWLKSAPQFIADELGYKVVGAINALTGDGLTLQEVQLTQMLVQPKIDALLNDCEHVGTLIHNNIKLEYEHMKRNNSLVADLYDQLYHLMDVTLNQVHHCQNQTPGTPTSFSVNNMPSRKMPTSTLLKYLDT